MQHIKSATNSRNEAYPDYLTTASYDELAKQIRNSEGVVNSEIRVKTNPNGNGYYTEFDISMDGLQEAIKNLEINTDKLDEILSILNATNTKATFFVDGLFLENNSLVFYFIKS